MNEYKDFSSDEFALDADIQKLINQYSSIIASSISEMFDTLAIQMLDYKPSPEALQAHPFLNNIPGFLGRYRGCITTDFKEGKFSIGVDTNLLEKNGLPVDTMLVVEYGDQFTPPFPHIRLFAKIIEAQTKKVFP